MSFPESPHLRRQRVKNTKTTHLPTVMLNRIKQPSTIKGILALLSLFGIEFTEGVSEAISTFVLAGLALWEVIRDERKIPKAEVVE